MHRVDCLLDVDPAPQRGRGAGSMRDGRRPGPAMPCASRSSEACAGSACRHTSAGARRSRPRSGAAHWGERLGSASAPAGPTSTGTPCTGSCGPTSSPCCTAHRTSSRPPPPFVMTGSVPGGASPRRRVPAQRRLLRCNKSHQISPYSRNTRHQMLPCHAVRRKPSGVRSAPAIRANHLYGRGPRRTRGGPHAGPTGGPNPRMAAPSPRPAALGPTPQRVRA